MDIFGEFSPLLILTMILGLVEFAKRLSITGNASLILSMVLGVVFGLLWMVAQLYPVVLPWLQAVVFGLLFGLAASGIYDLGKRFTGK